MADLTTYFYQWPTFFFQWPQNREVGFGTKRICNQLASRIRISTGNSALEEYLHILNSEHCTWNWIRIPGCLSVCSEY
jgi:hypothetical protein